MTEQSIDPAIWRAVADELERIASAEWPSRHWVFLAIDAVVQTMPRCPQRSALDGQRSFTYDWEDGTDAHQRWILRALAGALRAEAGALRAEAAGAEKIQPEQATCPNCGLPVGWDVQICACGIEL